MTERPDRARFEPPSERQIMKILIAGALATGAVLVAGCGSDTTATRTVTVSQGAAAPAKEIKATPLPSTPPALTDIGAGLKGRAGLAATVMARGVTNVSDFALDAHHRLFVTRGSEGAHKGDGVYLLTNGTKPQQVVSHLAAPLGLTFVGDDLYVASERRVDRYSGFTGRAFNRHKTILSGLPAGTLGWNDNLRQGPDGRLYMGIGSPCDACLPKDNLAGTIVSLRPDGKQLRIFADNVRGNAFLAFLPGTDKLFAGTNQINAGGTSQPPDEFGLIEEGSDWGNPWCLRREGKACEDVARPLATLDTHAVVDGITFLPSSWGTGYASTAVVSEWAPGKLVSIALKPRGDSFTATPSVLVTGLHNPGPLSIATDGAMLVGEYHSGTIYRIAPGKPAAAPSTTSTTGATTTPPGSSGTKLGITADAGGQLKFAQSTLTANAGRTAITFDNPSAVPHDVEISQNGKPLVKTRTITQEKTTVSVTLKPGKYSFYCTVPGHRQAGMTGTLTVS
jgi:glucose/arabinose dehydrogenase/plastocyanin